MDDPRFLLDVGPEAFETEVIERSATTPVVVDFWAPWCGPCRSLGPLLEGLAASFEGAFVLARVNVDEAPDLAQRYGVRGIPAVLGFRDGRPVSQFVGAQPEPAVRAFLEGLLPTAEERLAEEGEELAAAGHANAAEERFRAALAGDARQPRALLGLARILAEHDAGAALELLERVPPTEPWVGKAEHLAAELRSGRLAPAPADEAGADEEALRRRVAEAPDDLGARIALGRWLGARERTEEALEELLAAVKRDPGFDDAAARKAMLDLFEVLGGEHPLTQRFRAELARALFR